MKQKLVNTIELIDFNLSQVVAIQPYRDPEVILLQLEINILAQELTKRQRLKARLEAQIQTLSRRYKQELGHLLAELLQLRRDQLAGQAAQAPDKQAAYEQARTAYDNFEAQNQTSPQKEAGLAPAQHQELKKLFRQACKLCHPDVVADEFKTRARATFIELKTAYEQNDLARVAEIYRLLSQAQSPREKAKLAGNKAALAQERDDLRQRLQLIRGEIIALKQSKSYQRLLSTDDWDDYFAGIKAKLQRQINRLKRKNK